jgi:hypothetical protein
MDQNGKWSKKHQCTYDLHLGIFKSPKVQLGLDGILFFLKNNKLCGLDCYFNVTQ